MLAFSQGAARSPLHQMLAGSRASQITRTSAQPMARALSWMVVGLQPWVCRVASVGITLPMCAMSGRGGEKV
eukprot:160732-Prymnesium_polylepis.1